MAKGGGKGGLRIIGGSLRGRKLATPEGDGLLRPMRNQVRGALFNSLGPLDGEVVLDLFAGSGSLGIEALSRGAQRAVFVDKNPFCLKFLEGNIASLGLKEKATVLRHDLARGVAELVGKGPFDLVLVHPPFVLLRQAPGPGEPNVAELLTAVATTAGLLRPEARIAFETPQHCYRDPASELPGLEVTRRKEYGSTALFISRPAAP